MDRMDLKRFARSLVVLGRLPLDLLRSGERRGVAMFHTGRSGSTVLGKMLEQHPRIRWGGEIFEGYRRDELGWLPHFLPAMWQIRIRKATTLEEVYGFETKHLPAYHLSETLIDKSLDDYVEELTAMGFTHFIELRRENYLRQLVSSIVGRQIGKWHRGRHDPPELTRVTVQVSAVETGETAIGMLERFKELDRLSERTCALLEGRPLLRLTYERDIESDPHVAYEKVCTFLDLDPADPEITLRRTTPFPLQEVVENWGEVQEELTGTRYEWMLSGD